MSHRSVQDVHDGRQRSWGGASPSTSVPALSQPLQAPSSPNTVLGATRLPPAPNPQGLHPFTPHRLISSPPHSFTPHFPHLLVTPTLSPLLNPPPPPLTSPTPSLPSPCPLSCLPPTSSQGHLSCSLVGTQLLGTGCVSADSVTEARRKPCAPTPTCSSTHLPALTWGSPLRRRCGAAHLPLWACLVAHDTLENDPHATT